MWRRGLPWTLLPWEGVLLPALGVCVLEKGQVGSLGHFLALINLS